MKSINKFVFVFLTIVMLLSVVVYAQSSESYTQASVQFTQPGTVGAYGGNRFPTTGSNIYPTNSYGYSNFNSYGSPERFGATPSSNYLRSLGFDLYSPLQAQQQCGIGTDFVIQVAPFGCQPSVVRSDLLEEHNVPVFCQLAATKVNPLIEVEAIESIQFNGGEYERDYVAGVGFHPANAAIKGNFDRGSLLNSPVLNNIGYAVVVLKRQPNEAAMPEFVSGNLTATIRYDVKNAFGIGESDFLLQEINQNEWEQNYQQYSFWNGKGYLRAEQVDKDGTVISLYADKDHRVQTITLKRGQSSGDIYLPGFYCQAKLNIQLEEISLSDTKAKFYIDGDYVEAVKGQRFLENRCVVQNIEKSGISQKVSVRCTEDDGTNSFELKIAPKVVLNVADAGEKEYELGQLIAVSNSSNKIVLEDLDKDSTGKIFIILGEREIDQQSKFERTKSKSEKIFLSLSGENNFDFKGVKGKFVGLPDVIDEDYEQFSGTDAFEGDLITFKNNFESSMNEYGQVDATYGQEKIEHDYEGSELYGAQALWEAQRIASVTNQNQKRIDLLNNLLERYPSSQYISQAAAILNEKGSGLSGEGATRGVFVNGVFRLISFSGIDEPSFEESGVVLGVKDASGNLNQLTIGNGGRAPLTNAGEFVELNSLKEDSASLNVNYQTKSGSGAVFNKASSLTLNAGETKSVGDYTFTLSKINSKNFARIKVVPGIENTRSQTNFSFAVGIEKRAIQLTPQQTQSRIDKLDETISTIEDVNQGLGDIVKGFKAACFATGTGLTVKNFIQNLGGKQLARQEVMRSEGGWFDICNKQIEDGIGNYNSLDHCLSENGDEIDADVNTLSDIYENQNKEIKELKAQYKDNSDGYLNAFRQRVLQKVEGLEGEIINPKDGTSTINKEELVKSVSSEESIEDLRDLERQILVSKSGVSENIKQANNVALFQEASGLVASNRENIESKSYQDELRNKGLGGVTVGSYGMRGSIIGTYGGGVTTSQVGGIAKDEPVEGILWNNKKYILVLGLSNGNTYGIKEITDEAGVRVTDEEVRTQITNHFNGFKKFDRLSYQNDYKNPEARYFENEPYKGLPAIVPFDLSNGWYAATKQSIATLGGGIRAFDDSGRVNSIYVCNIGENGRENFDSGIGDDICGLVNLGIGQDVSQFAGLEPSEARQITQRAVKAIEEASRQYQSGVSNIRIEGRTIPVGNPASNVPQVQCQDFMSPKDCYILFNVCDPVICPSSRCNLGGAYHVDNVIQSGIVGSIALCAPNYKEGIGVPICLSGVNAGLEGLN